MKAATACFTTVTLRLQRLFRRLPKSHLGSEKLQALQSFRHKAQLACGRSRLLQLGGCSGAAWVLSLSPGEGIAGASGSLVPNAELSSTPGPPLRLPRDHSSGAAPCQV